MSLMTQIGLNVGVSAAGFGMGVARRVKDGREAYRAMKEDRPTDLSGGYGSSDVRTMKSQAEAVIGRAADLGAGITPLLGTTISVDGAAKWVTKNLPHIDAKYENVDPAKVKARVTEFLVSMYFSDIHKRSDDDLRSIGLDDGQMKIAKQLQQEIRSGRLGGDKKTPEIDAGADSVSEVATDLDALLDDVDPHESGRDTDIDKLLAELDALEAKLDSPDGDKRSKSAEFPKLADQRIAVGWLVMDRLGIEPDQLGEGPMASMSLQAKGRAAKYQAAGEALTRLAKGRKKTLATMMVDFARFNRMSPDEFSKLTKTMYDSMGQLSKLKMAGPEIGRALAKGQEVRALLTMAIDQMLSGQGTMLEEFGKLEKDPDFQDAVFDAFESPAVKGLEDTAMDFVDGLERIGARF